MNIFCIVMAKNTANKFAVLDREMCLSKLYETSTK